MTETQAMRQIQTALLETGLSHQITPGRKHFKVFLRDRMIGVFSRGTDRNPRGLQNLISTIRRTARIV